MKKIYFLAILTISSISLIRAQQPGNVKTQKDDRFLFKNSVQLELGGHGLIYSLNYERNLLNFNHFKTSVQVGFSFYPKPVDLRSRLWVPISFNQLFSLKSHHIETGIGMVITEYQNYSTGDEMHYEKNMQPLLTAKIGYRYQSPAGRMQYKLLFTPVMEKDYGRLECHPLGALSIGYTFGK